MREVTLRAFSIESPPLLAETRIGIFQEVKKRLIDSLASDRVMLLNQGDESKEADLLSDFTIQDNNIFGIIMRIAPGVDDIHIDHSLMEKSSFSLSDLKRQSGSKDRSAYRKHYYICFNDKFLCTTLSRPTTITRVETYLNWLVRSYGYSFTPLTSPPPDFTLQDVNSIVVKNLQKDYSTNTNIPTTENKIFDLNKKLLEVIKTKIFKDAASLNDIDMEKIVSAELLLRIKKNGKKDEDVNKLLGAILKPVSDTNQLIFRDKKGKTIKGSDIEETTSIPIETTEQGYLSEPSLLQQMSIFLETLNK